MRISSKNRKIIAIIVAAVMVFAVVAGAIASVIIGRADPTDGELQQMNELQQTQRQAQEALRHATQERNVELAEKARIDAQVTLIQAQVRQTREELAAIETQLAELYVQLEYATELADEYEEEFKERMRIMFESTPTTYFQIFLRSDSFSDMARRTNTMNEIAEYDEFILTNMRRIQEEIDESYRKIEIIQAEIQEILTREEAEAAELVRQQAEQDRFIQNLQNDINAFRRSYDEARRQEEALIRQIQARLSAAGDGSVFIGGTFLWPVPGHNIGSGAGSQFGYRIHPISRDRRFHSGIDIPAPSGTQILAANGGTVIFSGWNGGYGNCIIIDHGGGYATLYAHNSVNLVNVGDIVYRGQLIGRVGSTGNSTGPHLHFEVLRNGRAVDPMPYLGR